jgi:type IV pilus assembly protein PilV
MMRHSNDTRARQRGVTMVEALVALVVLSVGMLGIAGLYVSSLRAERTAQLRTQAVTLVNDMIDRIRANAQARAGYDMSKATPASHDCVASSAPSPCTSEEMAAEDLKTWTDSAKDTLPGGKGNIAYSPAAATGQPDTYAVTVEWVEPGTGADGAPMTLQYTNSLSLIAVTP